MAGIGFELRKLKQGDTGTSTVAAYTYAGLISSGPWIISILSIVILSVVLRPLLRQAELDFFSASVTHVYAFSLILVGPLQLVLTRYVADQFSFRSRSRIFPSLLSALVITAVVSGVVASVFFLGLVGGALIHKVAAAALMVYVSCIFIAANYLTALRGYKRVVTAFAVGYAASCLLAYGAVVAFGPDTAMLGFSCGHAVLFLMLLHSLHREFGTDVSMRWDVLSYFRKFPSLALTGILYNVGIWGDKLMFWWVSEHRLQISGALYAAPQYDVAIYLSLLSIVPGMAVFFLKLETDFAERYQAFFDAIDGGKTLSQIVACREAMTESLRDGFRHLLAVQGITTLLLLVFADQVANAVGIGSIQMGIFRVTLFGAFLLIGFLSLLTILFYFDDRKGALVCTAVFATANVGLSIPTILANEAWYGIGFVFAAGFALMIALVRVNHRLANLESHIFRGV
ncbi:MAG: exopolysaccharide Pel transporter PelG [Verrucomicrobiae bacterium]|nr:exopolysaccharide Pel transporter PelG [Verrucomicrobiae bacterium]